MSVITRLELRRIVLLAGLLLVAALAQASLSAAGTVTLSAGTLDYSAASGEENRIFIFHPRTGGYRIFEMSAAMTAGSGCTSVSANEAFCPTELSIDLHVDAGDMNDFIEVDAVFYREAILEGGEGSDELQGGGGVLNILDGGPGSDTFRPGPFGGPLQNVVDYSSRTNPVSVTLGDGLANDGEAGEQDMIENGFGRVWGGSGNDTISAHAVGFGFFDLSGRGGDDTLSVDNDSSLSGGRGDDTLVSNTSPNEGVDLFGGRGNDLLRGGKGFDDLVGGDGNDRLRCGEGTWAWGGPGADAIHGGPDVDRMRGGPGPDVLFARHGGRDLVSGDDGHDRARVDHLDRLRSIEELF